MFKPTKDIIVILPVGPQKETIKNGIVVLNPVTKDPYKGEIVAIGPEIDNMKVGDTAHYFPPATFTYEYEGKDYIITRQDGVIGIK